MRSGNAPHFSSFFIKKEKKGLEKSKNICYNGITRKTGKRKGAKKREKGIKPCSV